MIDDVLPVSEPAHRPPLIQLLVAAPQEQAIEDVQPEELAEAPVSEPDIVKPTDPPTMRIATVTEPQPLPTLSPRQLKAENHAVISVQRLRSQGSNASRRPSPTKLMAITVIKMAPPGRSTATAE